MIEVLKRGNKIKKYQIECDECYSIILVWREDIQQKTIYIRPLELGIEEYIHCPVCGNDIHLEYLYK